MLQKVEIRTAAGTLLSLTLEDETDGLYVQDITGLDPVKATLVSSSFAQLDGQQYQSSRRETRNIVMIIELKPDYVTASVRDLRTRLYGFLMPKSPISMRFYDDDGLTVDIEGRVESFETDLFAKEPTVNISIICFDPDFYDPVPVELTGSTVSDSTEMDVVYAGTVDTGILFTLNVNRSISGINLYQRLPNGSLATLVFTTPMVSGDVLKISTIPGNKYATLTHSGVDSSVLYAIDPTSNWVALQQGTNTLRVSVTGAAIPYTVDYTTKYGGL